MRKLALASLLFPLAAFANEPVAAPAAVVSAPAVVSAAADAAAPAPASAAHDAGVPSSAAPDAAPSIAPSVAPSAPASVAVVEEAPASNTPFFMIGCVIVVLAGLFVMWKKKA